MLEEKEILLNSKLQQKKNQLRTILADRGVQAKDKLNQFDHYSYFSEAGYKKLFTELFSQTGLELTTTIERVERYTAEGKQPNGRIIEMSATLTDTDTGYGETTKVFGEGLDKGDKALYKAYTGAIKYYLADTFLVATGDDPENDSPEAVEKPKRFRNSEVEYNKYNSFIDSYFAKKPELEMAFMEKYSLKKLTDLDKKISLQEIDDLITRLKNDLAREV